MRLSSKFVAPSAFAFLSTVMLCGPAASQPTTSAPVPVPSVTVEAPKPAATPKRVVDTGASRPTSSTRHTRSASTRSSTARTPAPAPDSVMGRIAKLERSASSCNGGCESSFPHGKDPWVGCSGPGGISSNEPFSPTCRDTLTYTSYLNCVETKVFLGEIRNRAYWFCSSLSAGNKFKVAELKRTRQPR